MRIAMLAAALVVAGCGSEAGGPCPDGGRFERVDAPNGNWSEDCYIPNPDESSLLRELRHGPRRSYYADGSPLTTQHWTHGVKAGLHLSYDEEGMVRRASCHNPSDGAAMWVMCESHNPCEESEVLARECSSTP